MQWKTIVLSIFATSLAFSLELWDKHQYQKNVDNNTIVINYSGSSKDIEQIEKALKQGKEVCVKPTSTSQPIYLNINNCKVSQLTYEESNLIKKLSDGITSIPKEVCQTNSCSFFDPFCWMYLMLDFFSDFICNTPCNKFIPQLLCNEVEGQCKELDNSCSFSWDVSMNMNKPFIWVGKMNTSINCHIFNFDFSPAATGMFVWDLKKITGKNNLSVKIQANSNFNFAWIIDHNWSGSGNVKVSISNLNSFYFSSESMTGSTNFNFIGSTVKNIGFIVKNRITGSLNLNFRNLNSIENFFFNAKRISGSNKIRFFFKKLKQGILVIDKVTGSREVCFKIEDCTTKGVLLWLEY